MSRRRVLITGAGGFVGRALAVGFADLGWGVIGLDRAFDVAHAHDGIRWLTAELADGVPPDVPGVDLVVHAAWVTTAPHALGITSAEYAALNTRPLLAVLDYAARTPPAAFVFVSSSGVFAPEDGTDGLTDVQHPTGSSPYAATKRAGEVLVPSALEEDTAAYVVRLGHLFGPGETSRRSRLGVSLVARWLAAARDGRPLEVRSDDPARDWTFTPDLAAALEGVVLAPPVEHPVHLGSPHACRDSALAALVATAFPGVEFVEVPVEGPVKPPMVPSDIPALRGFGWTDPAAGLRALLAGTAAA